MLNVVDQRCERLFVGRGESALEFLGVEPRVLPPDRDNRNVDVREDVGRRTKDDHRRGDENQQRKDNKSVRSVESNFDDLHIVLLSSTLLRDRRLSPA